MATTTDAVPFQWDTTTHDLTLSTTFTYNSGATTVPFGITVPGHVYDQLAGIIAAMVMPALLKNGTTGPVVPDDVARTVAKFYSALNTPKPAPTIQSGTADPI